MEHGPDPDAALPARGEGSRGCPGPLAARLPPSSTVGHLPEGPGTGRGSSRGNLDGSDPAATVKGRQSGLRAASGEADAAADAFCYPRPPLAPPAPSPLQHQSLN